MKEEINKLHGLIEDSERILITSHIGPDGDAVASSLLLSDILQTNFSDKKVTVALEEEPYDLDFLKGIEKIEIAPIAASITEHKPDLLFLLDANTVSRISRDPDEARSALKSVGSRLVIIDHHEPEGVEPNDLYINHQSPAVTLDIYEIFLKNLGLKKPDGYAQTAITGIYTDTGGFINRNLNYQKTFQAVPELINDGADVEQVASQLKKISEKGAQIFAELMGNLSYGEGFTYSYISDQTAGAKDNLEALRQATDLFRSDILRNVDGKPWGFIVYKDVLGPVSTYSASFRAQSGAKDVSRLAAALGGGGHKPAAGAKFEASNIEEAIQKVRAVIESAG